MGPWYRQTTTAFATVLVAAVIVTWGTVGVGVAGGQSAEDYSVRQGGECFGITPLSGDEPVKQFYGYHTTIENDSSATGVGPSFSSEGTFDLQRAETSLLFLYAAPDGNLSLVMIHGARQEGEDGGAASFNITDLPEDGQWVVKDDDYDSPNNTDRWSHGPTTAEIDWAWSRSATDGGAFAGLGDDFEVTVEPAFNGEAELFGVENWGVVDNWTVLSGNRSNPGRTPLDLSENVTISTEGCDDSVRVPDDRDDERDGEGRDDRGGDLDRDADDGDDRGVNRGDGDDRGQGEPNRGDDGDRDGDRDDRGTVSVADEDDDEEEDDDEDNEGDDEEDEGEDRDDGEDEDEDGEDEDDQEADDEDGDDGENEDDDEEEEDEGEDDEDDG